MGGTGNSYTSNETQDDGTGNNKLSEPETCGKLQKSTVKASLIVWKKYN